METTKRRGRGRPPTGATTTTIRIPTALKPAIEQFVRAYRQTVTEIHADRERQPRGQDHDLPA